MDSRIIWCSLNLLGIVIGLVDILCGATLIGLFCVGVNGWALQLNLNSTNIKGN